MHNDSQLDQITQTQTHTLHLLILISMLHLPTDNCLPTLLTTIYCHTANYLFVQSCFFL